jgi:hypothetical protein
MNFCLKSCTFGKIHPSNVSGRKNRPLRVKCVGQDIISWLALVLRRKGGEGQDLILVVSFTYKQTKKGWLKVVDY